MIGPTFGEKTKQDGLFSTAGSGRVKANYDRMVNKYCNICYPRNEARPRIEFYCGKVSWYSDHLEGTASARQALHSLRQSSYPREVSKSWNELSPPVGAMGSGGNAPDVEPREGGVSAENSLECIAAPSLLESAPCAFAFGSCCSSIWKMKGILGAGPVDGCCGKEPP